MRYAIIAAGEGSRLASEGISKPKPLVQLGNELLIDRLIRIFMDNGAEEIVVICNDKTAQVASHLARLQRDGLYGRPVPLRFLVKSTPSSMHSLFEISQFLEGAPFILTTVDTVFSEQEFRRYVDEVRSVRDGEGVMAVTDYVDDESPLYVETDNMMNIRGFHDEPNRQPFISAGIYGLPSKALDTLRRCVERGESRMRNFQRALITDGFRLRAHKLGKVVDVDHAGDIVKAGELLGLDALLVKRDAQFSPGSEDKDLRILKTVAKNLELRGYKTTIVEERELSMTAHPTLIFSMARSQRALDILKKVPCPVVNSPESVEICNSRIAVDRLMRENNIPCAPLESDSGYWVKSDKGHEMEFVKEKLGGLKAPSTWRGMGEAPLIVGNVEGKEVKFYGVRGRYFYPKGMNELRHEAERLADIIGIDVYGGDGIVRDDGTFAIIDFNDWPSFSPCVEEAAEHIAELDKNQRQ